jgi:hypothetical protein
MPNHLPELNEISSQNPFSVKGVNGIVEFDGMFVYIKRKGAVGFISQGLKGDKQIPVQSITSVQLKKSGWLTNGYIQFATAAGENIGGLQEAATNENSVIFLPKYDADFERLKELVMSAISRQASGQPSAPAASTQPSNVESIEKLADLLDRGLITQEEFAAEKARIFSRD